MVFQGGVRSSESTLCSFVQNLSNKRVSVLIVHVLREFQTVFENLFIDFVWVLSVLSERHESSHKLIENNSQRPKINAIGISLTSKNFWSHIVRSSNNGESFLNDRFLVDLLASSHINKFKVAVFANHNIFRLQISVNNIGAVHGLQYMKQNRCVKLTLLYVQNSDDSDCIEKLKTIDELHKEVNIVTILKRANIVNCERGIDLLKNVLLVQKMFLKFAFNCFVFRNALQSVEFGFVWISNQENCAELPFSQLLYHLEVT